MKKVFRQRIVQMATRSKVLMLSAGHNTPEVSAETALVVWSSKTKKPSDSSKAHGSNFQLWTRLAATEQELVAKERPR